MFRMLRGVEREAMDQHQRVPRTADLVVEVCAINAGASCGGHSLCSCKRLRGVAIAVRLTISNSPPLLEQSHLCIKPRHT